MKPELVSEKRLGELCHARCLRGGSGCPDKPTYCRHCPSATKWFAGGRAALEELGIVQILEVPESTDLLERRREFAMDEHAAVIKGVLRHVKLEDGPVLVRATKGA